MLNNKNHHIVIIGAGITGLTFASLLQNQNYENQNVNITILEKLSLEELYTQTENRTIAITNSTVQIFNKLSNCNNINVRNGTIENVEIYDNSNVRECLIESKTLKTLKCNASLGSNVFIADITKDLTTSLQFNKNNNVRVNILFNAEITDIIQNKNNIKVNVIYKNTEQEIECNALFVASGYNSKLFSLDALKSFNFFNHNYNQTAIMINVIHEKPHNNTATEKFTQDGAIAMLPIKNQHESTLIFDAKSSIVNAIKNFSPMQLENYINNLTLTKYGKIIIKTKPMYYSLNLKIANNFCNKNIYLIGQALRTIHPVIAQDFNNIVSDLLFISKEISINIKDGKNNYVSLFKWRLMRLPFNIFTVVLSHFLVKIFKSNNTVITSFRSFCMISATTLNKIAMY